VKLVRMINTKFKGQGGGWGIQANVANDGSHGDVSQVYQARPFSPLFCRSKIIP
jgi:hypothetical protein